MKAIVLDGFGAAECMHLGDREDPSPAAGQVRIRVMASSVNRPDIVQREGHYPAPAGESDVLGLDVSGVVDQVGEGVDGVAVGDRVMALLAGGGYAELAIADAGHCLPLPDTLDFLQGACIPETYLTAYLNLFELGELRRARAALLHGGGGGVNTAAVQLARVLTPEVVLYVTASARRLEAVQALGAHHVIDYREQDFATEIRHRTAKRGVDVILDHVGAPYLTDNLKSLAIDGRLVLIGVMGGNTAELNLALVMVKRHRLIGSVLRSRPADEKRRLIARFRDDVLPHLADGAITPLVSHVYALHDAVEAHRAMESGLHFGKIVLAVDPSLQPSKGGATEPPAG